MKYEVDAIWSKIKNMYFYASYSTINVAGVEGCRPITDY
jgi:hypothetical protein